MILCAFLLRSSVTRGGRWIIGMVGAWDSRVFEVP
jgi:hypothetical protein